MIRPESASVSRWLNRRRWLQEMSHAALGLSLPGLFQARAAQAGRTANDPKAIKSCVFIFHYGGPSHLDTLDPKPDAPQEIRGDFQSIPTTVSGVRLCEHLPRLAKLMHKVALIRTMNHGLSAHDPAAAETLTGRTPLSGNKPFGTDTFPSHGACLSHVWKKKSLPLCHASLPFVMNNIGVRTPGQTPGFLGSTCAPLEIEVDPLEMSYRIEALKVPTAAAMRHLQERRTLLKRLEEFGSVQNMGPHYQKAFELLESEAVRRALDIRQEPLWVRERYGLEKSTDDWAFARNMRGQNLLLARRLVEAGVPFVNVHDFRDQGPQRNWDSHTDIFPKLKTYLLPQYDQGLSAFIEDLAARGLLDTTLVISVGEFGRAPRISETGRPHWPKCYSALLAGGGVRGGAVYGKSDRSGAYPAASPVSPADLAATIFWRFGLDPTTELHDLTGRPYPLADGKPLRALFEGA